jgi:hypothetical protein
MKIPPAHDLGGLRKPDALKIRPPHRGHGGLTNSAASTSVRLIILRRVDLGGVLSDPLHSWGNGYPNAPYSSRCAPLELSNFRTI